MKENIYWLSANNFLFWCWKRGGPIEQTNLYDSLLLGSWRSKRSTARSRTRPRAATCSLRATLRQPSSSTRWHSSIRKTFLSHHLPWHFWATVYLQNQKLLPPVDINVPNFVIFKGPRVWCLTKFSLSNLQSYFMLFAVHWNVQYLLQLLILCFFKGVVEDVSTN